MCVRERESLLCKLIKTKLKQVPNAFEMSEEKKEEDEHIAVGQKKNMQQETLFNSISNNCIIIIKQETK